MTKDVNTFDPDRPDSDHEYGYRSTGDQDRPPTGDRNRLWHRLRSSDAQNGVAETTPRPKLPLDFFAEPEVRDQSQRQANAYRALLEQPVTHSESEVSEPEADSDEATEAELKQSDRELVEQVRKVLLGDDARRNDLEFATTPATTKQKMTPADKTAAPTALNQTVEDAIRAPAIRQPKIPGLEPAETEPIKPADAQSLGSEDVESLEPEKAEPPVSEPAGTQHQGSEDLQSLESAGSQAPGLGEIKSPGSEDVETLKPEETIILQSNETPSHEPLEVQSPELEITSSDEQEDTVLTHVEPIDAEQKTDDPMRTDLANDGHISPETESETSLNTRSIDVVRRADEQQSEEPDADHPHTETLAQAQPATEHPRIRRVILTPQRFRSDAESVGAAGIKQTTISADVAEKDDKNEEKVEASSRRPQIGRIEIDRDGADKAETVQLSTISDEHPQELSDIDEKTTETPTDKRTDGAATVTTPAAAPTIKRVPRSLPPVKRVPLRCQNLAEAMKLARRSMPLPLEMQTEQQPVHYTWLMAQLRYAKTDDQLYRLAYSLEYKDIALLFPALATMKRRDQADRISFMILARASRYLYHHGWVTLQQSYPRAMVAKALNDLCDMLGGHERFSRRAAKLKPDPVIPAPELGDNRLAWSRINLISDIAQPTSRTFIADIVRAAMRSEKPLTEFFKQYGIYEDLPLGEEIKQQWAALHPDPDGDDRLLSHTLLKTFRRR